MSLKKISKSILHLHNPKLKCKCIYEKENERTYVYKSSKNFYKVFINPVKRTTNQMNPVEKQVEINKILFKLGVALNYKHYKKIIVNKSFNKRYIGHIIVSPRYTTDYKSWIWNYEPSEIEIKAVNRKFINPMIEKIHSKGILHGDLHSANIILKLKNDKVVDAKMIDFEQTYIPDITTKSRLEFLCSDWIEIYDYLEEEDVDDNDNDNTRWYNDFETFEKFFYTCQINQINFIFGKK